MGSVGRPMARFGLWGSLAFALAIVGAAAFPVARWLIARGLGHAVVHRHQAGTMGDMDAHGTYH